MDDGLWQVWFGTSSVEIQVLCILMLDLGFCIASVGSSALRSRIRDLRVSDLDSRLWDWIWPVECWSLGSQDFDLTF